MSEYYFPRWRKCDEGCHALYPAHEVSTNDDTDMTAFCGPGSGRNQDSTVADYNDECGYYAPYMVGIMAACIIVPYGAFLRFAAMCPCIQVRDGNTCSMFVAISRKTLRFAPSSDANLAPISHQSTLRLFAKSHLTSSHLISPGHRLGRVFRTPETLVQSPGWVVAVVCDYAVHVLLGLRTVACARGDGRCHHRLYYIHLHRVLPR